MLNIDQPTSLYAGKDTEFEYSYATLLCLTYTSSPCTYHQRDAIFITLHIITCALKEYTNTNKDLRRLWQLLDDTVQTGTHSTRITMKAKITDLVVLTRNNTSILFLIISLPIKSWPLHYSNHVGYFLCSTLNNLGYLGACRDFCRPYLQGLESPD